MEARFSIKRDLIIRSLKAGDINSIIEMALIEGWITEAREFETHRRLRGALGVVLTEGTEVIGCATVFPHCRSAWIGNLLVRPDRRRRGLGTRLVRHAVDWTESRRVETLLLAADSQAVSLYRRLGFKPLTQIYRWRREGNFQLSFKQSRGDKHSLRQMVSLDTDCWDDDRSKLLKIMRPERDCVVLPDDTGFLMYGRVGDFLIVGPGAVSRFDDGRVEDLVDRALYRVGSERPVVLDAFPANKRMSKVLDTCGFSVVSSTLLMYKGRTPDIKCQNVLATASLGSMG